MERNIYLEQTPLNEVFEGRLIPRDPGDEPAEKLLERIKAERQKVIPRKKRNTKNTGKKRFSSV